MNVLKVFGNNIARRQWLRAVEGAAMPDTRVTRSTVIRGEDRIYTIIADGHADHELQGLEYQEVNIDDSVGFMNDNIRSAIGARLRRESNGGWPQPNAIMYDPALLNGTITAATLGAGAITGAMLAAGFPEPQVIRPLEGNLVTTQRYIRMRGPQ